MAIKKWSIIQKCVKGDKQSEYCEDYCYANTDSSIYVMALCDGMSTSALSYIGAKTAAEFSVDFFAAHFDELCDKEYKNISRVLINYHQTFLDTLSKVAKEHTGHAIINEKKKINTEELDKYSTTIQIVAIRQDRCIYFKVGNGCAIIFKNQGTEMLSDSADEGTTHHLTFAKTLSVLKECDISSFMIPDDYIAILLSTDGAKFKDGIYHNHHPETRSLDLQNKVVSGKLSQNELEKMIQEMQHDASNIDKDDIGISIIYSSCSTSQCTSDDTIPIDNENELISAKSDTNNILVPAEQNEIADLSYQSSKYISDIIAKAISALDRCIVLIDRILSK